PGISAVSVLAHVPGHDEVGSVALLGIRDGTVRIQDFKSALLVKRDRPHVVFVHVEENAVRYIRYFGDGQGGMCDEVFNDGSPVACFLESRMDGEEGNVRVRLFGGESSVVAAEVQRAESYRVPVRVLINPDKTPAEYNPMGNVAS